MPTLPPRRIAIFGTFDVENYGDLLFPLIARRRLAEAGIEVVGVSPTSETTRYGDAPAPLAQAEFTRDAGQFDGILIGGGNIVHLRDFGLPGYGAMAYPALWAGATALAVRHGMPVMWNGPGVLAPPEPGPPPGWLQRVVTAADRFAVRDVASADAMERWSGRRPDVMPDTALDLPRVWPAKTLRKRLASIRTRLGVPADGPLVALHVKERSLGRTSVATFAEALSQALESCKATAVLVAIGRCHGDHLVAQAIHRAAPTRTFAFDEADKLQDIAAVIAGADAYLGASLHGHITAAAYGVPARLVTVPALHKFAGQAVQMDRTADLVATWDAALRDLPKVLAQPRQPLPASVATQLEAHWQEVARLVAAGRRDRKRPDVFANPDLDKALAGAVRLALGDAAGPAARAPAPPAKPPQQPPPAIDWDREAVDKLIRDNDLDGAAARVAAALAKSPKHLPARLAEVRLAQARRDLPQAVALAERLSDDWPDNPWVWLCHLQSLAAADRHDAALRLFQEGLRRPEIDESVMSGAINDLLATVPVRQQVAFLQAALTARPDSRALQLRLAMRAHASGEYRLALDMLARAEAAGPLPPYAARVKTQLLPFQGPMAAAVDQLSAQVQGGATDVETLCRLCRFAAAAGRFDVAASALDRALDLHPLEWRTLYRLNRVFLGQSADSEIFARLAHLDETAAPGVNWRLQYSLFALRAGQEAQGRQTLAQLSGLDVVGPTARSLLAALESLGPAEPRAPVVADAHVRVVRQPDARGTLLVFGGLLGGLSHIPDRHLDRLLADLPANVIYLRDPYSQVFLKGVPELGPDEPAMQAALIRQIADLGGGRVVTMGGSAGGYAALRAGLAIGADAVISLAGFVTPGAAEAGDHVHGRQGLDELFGGDAQTHDLRPALRSDPRLRLTHVVGGSYAPDLARARAIEGLDNARVLVMPGVDTHHVALPAIADGTLRQILESAFAD